MKKQLFLIGFALVFAAELIALIVFAVHSPNISQDAVAVNEVMRSVTADFNTIDTHRNATQLDYVVLNADSGVLYKTRSGLSESVNAAIAHRDTLLDVEIDGNAVGRVIVYNDGAQTLQSQKQTAITVLSVAIAVQFAINVGYGVYLHFTVVKPFRELKGFAERVACGNLDIPLAMDKGNLFGAFTESFDIMRSELKKARLAEAQANASKKELVAKLSHDIKTPCASIKAVSEVGLAVTSSSKDKDNYTQIVSKADQINTLVSNLFTATLEELQQLTVAPVNTDSDVIADLLANADYMRKASIPLMPQCTVYADRLRLQQVFDNVFANSYKYADTAISVGVVRRDASLSIVIEDNGGGVKQDELPTIKDKYKRGSNSADTEGAGLGLYIADYFMREMNGELTVENGDRGLKVTVTLMVSNAN